MRKTLAVASLLASCVAPAFASPWTTGRVMDSADGRLPAAGLTMMVSNDEAGRCWSGTQVLSTARADGYLFDSQDVVGGLAWPTVLQVEGFAPDPGAPFDRAGYFATRLVGPADAGGANVVLAAMRLEPIPAPAASVVSGDVRLAWSHAVDVRGPLDSTRGVLAYAVFRSPSGADAFVEIGRVDSSAALELLDDTVTSGTWDYALKVVLAPVECGTTEHLSASFSRIATVDLVVDRDGDGVVDSLDTCPLVADPAQIDADLDGIGDACEPRHPTLVVRKLGTQLRFESTFVSQPAGTVHDLHAQDLPARTGDAAGFRDPARDVLACNLPPGTGLLVELADAAPRRFYLLSVVTPEGRDDLGNESRGRARTRTTTLPDCR